MELLLRTMRGKSGGRIQRFDQRFDPFICGDELLCPICHKSPWTKQDQVKETGRTAEKRNVLSCNVPRTMHLNPGIPREAKDRKSSKRKNRTSLKVNARKWERKHRMRGLLWVLAPCAMHNPAEMHHCHRGELTLHSTPWMLARASLMNPNMS